MQIMSKTHETQHVCSRLGHMCVVTMATLNCVHAHLHRVHSQEYMHFLLLLSNRDLLFKCTKYPISRYVRLKMESGVFKHVFTDHFY